MMDILRLGVVNLIILIIHFQVPSIRGILTIPMIHVFIFSAFMLIGRLFGCNQAPAITAKKFFSGFRAGGHRGAPTVEPENTIESFEKARQSKMDLVEFDLALSKDGVAVLMHDDDLWRTCGVRGLVSSFRLEELKAQNAGRTLLLQRNDSSVYKIPTLEEVVYFCRDNNLKMLFDVKDSRSKMVSQIVNLIRTNNLYEHVIVSSFFPWVSYAVKKADPNILTGLTWRPYFFSYSDLENTEPRFSGFKHFAAVALDFLNVKLLNTVLPRFLGVEMLLTNEKDINSALVTRMRKNDVEVVAWTVNDERQMLYYLDTLKISFLTDVPHVFEKIQPIRGELLNH